jgi:hypothetical protein
MENWWRDDVKCCHSRIREEATTTFGLTDVLLKPLFIIVSSPKFSFLYVYFCDLILVHQLRLVENLVFLLCNLITLFWK